MRGLRLLGPVCLLVLMLVACSVPAQRRAQTTHADEVPFDLLDPAAAPLVPAPTGPDSEKVALCFVRDRRLLVIDVELATPVTLRATLDALATPPSDAGALVRTALPDPSIVRDVRVVGGIARVDLVAAVSALPADEQLLAVAQSVCTLTGRPGVGQVSFTLEGAHLAVPTVDGSLVTSPVARDNYAAMVG